MWLDKGTTPVGPQLQVDTLVCRLPAFHFGYLAASGQATGMNLVTDTLSCFPVPMSETNRETWPSSSRKGNPETNRTISVPQSAVSFIATPFIFFILDTGEKPPLETLSQEVLEAM